MTSNEPAPIPTYEQLRAVVWELHNDAELQSQELHRTLHDEFGALIVAAAMDLGTLAAGLSGNGPFEQRLRRAHRNIMSAVDLKRRLSEDLRPSLLDNIGLFAALRWHTRHGCAHSVAVCSEHYPDQELSLTSAAMTTLYRIAQESLDLVLHEPELRRVDVAAKIDDAQFEMTLAHEHEVAEPVDLFGHMPERMHSLCERTRSLGGEMRVAISDRGTVLIHRFPVARITAGSSS